MPAATDRVLDTLLSRRVVLVTGKGGTGKTTVAAALARLAAATGRRVLCVDVDAKGDLAGAVGRDRNAPEQVLALRPEESLQEYLRIYFRVPRLTRLTPLARVFDFVATGVPGIAEMLVVGKIAYEERRRSGSGPRWDLIVVDGAATGHTLPQLGAARTMMELAGGGIMRSQAAWVNEALRDPERTLMVICALAEEMPVAEAIELHDRVLDEGSVSIGACFLNRTFPVALSPSDLRTLEELAGGHAAELEARLGAPPAPLLRAARLGRRQHRRSATYARLLRRRLTVPVVEIPLQVGSAPGPALSDAVATALRGEGA